MASRAGIEQRNRGLLEQLHRAFTKPFSVAQVASELSLDRAAARKFLAHLASKGWLSRVRRDSYSLVPLGAIAPSEWRADPWIVAAGIFEPCYIGGWTACQHWELTEQIFRDIVVMSVKRVRHRLIEIQGTRFYLKIGPKKNLFGTRPVWRGQNKVEVSDASRTIVDILNDPTIGGGMRHVADVLCTYFESAHCDETKLLEYVARVGNRAIYKRLGYLAETLELATTKLIETCRTNLSAGLSLLDPSVRGPGVITKRWNLRLNVSIKGIREKS